MINKKERITHQKIKAGRRNIEITHPEKILFPKSKITKLQLVNYYLKIADKILPHLKDRPLTQVRCPDGILGDCFFQKNTPDYYPEWIERIPIEKQDKSIIEYVNCKDIATLIFLINQNCITPHTWLSKLPDLNRPDKIIFDLDPGEGATFTQIRETALKLNDLIKKEKLTSKPMVTGSKGIHVIIPIEPNLLFDEAKNFAKDLAQKLVDHYPEHLTLDVRKEKRKDKIFIDYLRNAWGATSVVPYGVRPRENAPVATPITWKDVEKKTLKPDQFNIFNIF